MTCLGKHHMRHDMQRTPSTWLVSWVIACWPGVVRPEAGFETSTVGPNIGQGPDHMSLLPISFPARARRERTINNGRPLVREMFETGQARIPRASVINVTEIGSQGIFPTSSLGQIRMFMLGRCLGEMCLNASLS